MSKRKEKSKSRLADWEITTSYADGRVTVPASWWTRDKQGGYTFSDVAGVVRDFAPGTVAYVRRVDEVKPAPDLLAAIPPARSELARKQANGGK